MRVSLTSLLILLILSNGAFGIHNFKNLIFMYYKVLISSCAIKLKKLPAKKHILLANSRL